MLRYPIPEDEEPSRAAYLAVAEARDTDPLDLPPLAKVIDTDALDAIAGSSSATEDASTTFEYAECMVTITADEVRVEQA